MADTLEIEMTMTCRGTLAERLARLAAEQGRPPVEIMADIVERGVKGPTEREIQAQRAEQRNRQALEIRTLRHEISDLRKQHQRLLDAKPKTIAYAPKTQAALLAAAKSRGFDFDDLIYEIIKTVTDDDLFAAVLDTE